MINVFVDNFTHKNPARAAELDQCFKLNTENKHINYHPMNSPSRMTYQNLFDYINSQTSDNDVNVISNLDIIFDDTILRLEEIHPNHFVALSRHEIAHDGTIYFNESAAKYSQDVWAWRGKTRISDANFYLGIQRCDNVLSHIARETGYAVINPSFSIKIYHIHLCNWRPDDYNTNIVEGDGWMIFPHPL